MPSIKKISKNLNNFREKFFLICCLKVNTVFSKTDVPIILHEHMPKAYIFSYLQVVKNCIKLFCVCIGRLNATKTLKNW